MMPSSRSASFSRSNAASAAAGCGAGAAAGAGAGAGAAGAAATGTSTATTGAGAGAGAATIGAGAGADIGAGAGIAATGVALIGAARRGARAYVARGIDEAGAVTELAFGLADRAHNLPNTPDTRFGMASGTKTFTALAVLSLVADGTMGLDDPARRWLGDDLPQISDGVTLRRLLSHTSGVGEGIDDDAEVDVHLLPGAPHSYESPEDYLSVIDRPMQAEPGTEFFYNNSGFVLLGLLAQRASGVGYHDLVRQRCSNRPD